MVRIAGAWVVVILLAVTTTVVADAAEQHDALMASLVWEDASGGSCLDESALRQSVETHLGRTVFVSADRADVELRVRVTRTAKDDLSAVVEMRGEGTDGGSRSLEAPPARCIHLRDMLAVVVAMLLDVPPDDVVERPSSPSSQPASAASPSTVPATPLPAPRESLTAADSPTPEPSSRWHAQGAVVGEGVLGVLPGLAFGAGLGVFVTPPRWPALFVAGDVLPSVIDGQAGGRIEYRALSASLGVAPLAPLVTDRLNLRPLVAATAGTIAAQASGFQQNESGSRWFAALSIGGDATFALGGGILATARVALLLPFVRPRFTYDGPDGPEVVHRVQSIGATIGLGLGWESR